MEHFKTDAWYRALLEGKPAPAPRKRKAKFEFQIEQAASVDKMQPQPLPDKVDDQSDAMPDDPVITTSESESEGSSKAGPPSDQNSQAGDGCDGGGTTPVGSHSSDHEHDRPLRPDAPKEQEAMPCETQWWRGFKFTPLYERFSLNHIGWEVSCFIPGHDGPPICRRTRNFASHGGRVMLERKLKQWCKQGFDAVCGTRMMHRDLPDAEPEGLPTLAAFETVPFPEVN